MLEGISSNEEHRNSRVLTGTERCCLVTELATLAVVVAVAVAVAKIRAYIRGRMTMVWTDHIHIGGLLQECYLTRRCAHWKRILDEYDLNFQ